MNASARARKATNKQKISEYNKRYRVANLDRELARIRENSAKYRKEMPEKYRARIKRWERANPEKTARALLEGKRRRRAREREVAGQFTCEQFAAMCEAYGNRCPSCGETEKLHADHIIPISKGGSNDILNIQPLCRRCNSGKGTGAITYAPSVRRAYLERLK